MRVRKHALRASAVRALRACAQERAADGVTAPTEGKDGKDKEGKDGKDKDKEGKEGKESKEGKDGKENKAEQKWSAITPHSELTCLVFLLRCGLRSPRQATMRLTPSAF